jgi:hypothetical protein
MPDTAIGVIVGVLPSPWSFDTMLAWLVGFYSGYWSTYTARRFAEVCQIRGEFTNPTRDWIVF